jgi:hypothetical protein
MGYATARKAARDNIALLEPHTNDRMLRALYNISVALTHLATNIESDVRALKRDIASVETKVRRIG